MPRIDTVGNALRGVQTPAERPGVRPVQVEVSCTVRPSFRVAQVQGMFDLPEAEMATERFSAELPDDSRPWQVGLIVGPSGSGKTTIARAAYGRLGGARRWPRDRAVIDGFGRRSIKEITAMLTAVGFSSPPAWIKPYHVLSQGERFRCDLARALLTGGRRVVFDEFTSVVDRTVARIGSAAVAKAVRRMAHPEGTRQFVAVTCHYDVAEWLEPDWVVDMAGDRRDIRRAPAQRGGENGTVPFTAAFGPSLQWVRLRRPELRLRLDRATPDVWPEFARYHYLSAALNRSAHCYVGVLEGMEQGAASREHEGPRNDTALLPVPRSALAACFAAVLSAIGRRGVWRVSRLVVLPDYQGVGIGRAMLAAVAEQYPRLRITTSHPAMLRALVADPNWRLAAFRRAGYTRQPNALDHAGFRGGAIGSSSAGRAVATFECCADSRGADATASC